MLEEGTAPTEVRIPQPWSVFFAAVGISALALFFVYIAITNLIWGDGFVVSTIFLSIAAIFLLGISWERGPAGLLLDVIGCFSRHHFARIDRGGDGAPVVRLGFRLAFLPLYHLSVPVAAIEKLEWSTGQASRITGKDMDDWSVALWYDRGAATAGPLIRADETLCVVCWSGPRERIEPFGRAFFEFLRSAGARLAEVPRPNTYLRARRGGPPDGEDRS